MAEMLQFFAASKKRLTAFVEAYLSRMQKNIAEVDPRWTKTTFSELSGFAIRGKMIRGSLVYLGAAMYGKKIDKNLSYLAAAIEIMHSSLLVHDDIMDRDDSRRGMPTMHMQFAHKGIEHGVSEPGHFGISSAICAGDIGFFLSSELLEHGLESVPKKERRIRQIFYHEVMKVGIAQIVEITESMRKEPLTPKKILNIYRHKTARYTFTLPLLMGALFAGVNSIEEKKLAELGEKIGMLFQIQDDFIGLYGDPKKTGKPVGSDISEGKKTLYYSLLLKTARQSEKKRLQDLLGKQLLSKQDLLFVRDTMQVYHIPQKVERMKERLEREALAKISSLHIRKQHKELLEHLVAYNISRNA